MRQTHIKSECCVATFLDFESMNAEFVDQLVNFARFLAKESAKATLPLFRSNLAVDAKKSHDWDPVTEADRSAERLIRQHIHARYPDHGIIGEEYGITLGTSGIDWILDPVDGTRSFVIGMPTWTTLIGVYVDGKPLIGIMYQPYVGEMFVGQPGRATIERHSETRDIRVRPSPNLSQAQIGTTTAQLADLNPNSAGYEKLAKTVQLTRYSGDAYFFSLVAAGHLDIAVDAGMQIYDIAALIPIIQGAGGCLMEWTGGDPTKGGNIIAANSEKLLHAAAEILRG